jgi:hypothetical protein
MVSLAKATIAILAVIVALRWIDGAGHRDDDLGQLPAVALASDEVAPVICRPHCRQLLTLDVAKLDALCDRLRIQRLFSDRGTKPSASALLHGLRLHGNDEVTTSELSEPVPILQVFLDSEVSGYVLGGSIFQLGPDGPRYRWRTSVYPRKTGVAERHYAQIIASLGEFGVPLSAPLMINGHRYRLLDIVRDFAVRFDSERHELEWAAVALALYLAPAPEWRDRFGVATTFDDVAAHLLATELTERSCAGTHVFYALTILARVDEKRTIFTPRVRNMLLARLTSLVDTMRQTQRADGSWSVLWFDTDAAKRAPGDGSLIVTGHLVESLLYLPARFKVPDDEVLRAGEWLWQALSQVPEDAYVNDLCPMTHALCALRHLLRRPNMQNAGTVDPGLPSTPDLQILQKR